MPKPPLTNEELKELVLLTSQNLKISNPSIIEKDYFVTYLIQALSAYKSEYFNLIFTGGTCLAKAYQVVKRMSEDIDFRIQLKSSYGVISKSSLRNQLSIFKKEIISLTQSLGVIPKYSAGLNDNRYIKIEVEYPKIFESNSMLRPHLLLEFNVVNPKLNTENISVKSLIEQTLDIQPIFLGSSVSCTSVQEIAMEKWVGLMRRVSAINRGSQDDDETIVRHIYDLHCLYQAKKLGEDFLSLGNETIISDGKQFRTTNPDFYISPIKEITDSMCALKDAQIWTERYNSFYDSMVYDVDLKFDYSKIVDSLEKVTAKILERLEN